MEFSVKKRINRILENIQRSQELAGLSDPQKGYVAPAEAYEDDFYGLQKRFGNINILKKIELFVQNNINQQLVFSNMDGENLYFKISPPITTNDEQSKKEIKSNLIFVRFGGYMSDSKDYTFSVGYKDKMNQEVFLYRFVMYLDSNITNWSSM
jgi:hypothetical protein